MILFFPLFLSCPKYKLSAYLCFWNSRGIYKCLLLGSPHTLCHLSLAQKSRLNLCCIEVWRSRDLSGNEVTKCEASFFWCCKLPCFEHRCEVSFFCTGILVYIPMMVSLKENSWVNEFEIFIWVAWFVHGRFLSGENDTFRVLFWDDVFYCSGVLYAWDHQILPENLNCSVWYHVTYFFPGPLCNFNKNSVSVAQPILDFEEILPMSVPPHQVLSPGEKLNLCILAHSPLSVLLLIRLLDLHADQLPEGLSFRHICFLFMVLVLMLGPLLYS